MSLPATFNFPFTSHLVTSLSLVRPGPIALRAPPQSSLALWPFAPSPWRTCKIPPLGVPRDPTRGHVAERALSCRNVDILVIGAGPTGLGAAKRLHHIVRTPLSPHAIISWRRLLTPDVRMGRLG